MANIALIWSRASVNPLVDLHIKFFRKYFAADFTRITHGMLKQGPCLFSQTWQVNLSNLDSGSCRCYTILSVSYHRFRIVAEYFLFQKLKLVLLYLMKLESLLPCISFPTTRFSTFIFLVQYSLCYRIQISKAAISMVNLGSPQIL